METPTPRRRPPPRLFRVAALFYLGLGAIGGGWIVLRQGGLRAGLLVGHGDPAEWWRELALGAACAALLLASWAVALRLLPRAGELEARLTALLGPLKPREVLGLAALSGVAEELFFRGAVQLSIGGASGWLLASCLFALAHQGPGPAFRLWTAFAALAGLLLGGLVAWRGNLLAPMLAHFLVNAVNLARLAGRAGVSARLPTPKDVGRQGELKW